MMTRGSAQSGMLATSLAIFSGLFMLLLVVLLQALHLHLCNSHSSWSHVLPFISADLQDSESARQQLHHLLFSMQKSIQYEIFVLRPPSFASDHDRKLFYKNNENKKDILPPSNDRLLGKIQVLQNASVHSHYDCGWQTDPSVFMNETARQKTTRKYHVVLPLLVPQSNTFQHFVDGVIPKIIQAHDVLQIPNVTLVVLWPWDRIIEEIIQALGIPRERVMYYNGGYLVSDYVINTCVTPPLHPHLWQTARTRLISWSDGMVEQLSQREPKNSPMYDIIFLTRAKFRNPGRFIINKEEVISYLKIKFTNVFIFEGGYNLNQSINIFRNARIILGVHGGALYNILFSPPGTHVIEILPTNASGEYVPEKLAHNIFWKMSNLLDLTYWRISEIPRTQRGDVLVNLKSIENIFHQINLI